MRMKMFLIVLMGMILLNLVPVLAGTEALNRDVFVGPQGGNFGYALASGDFNGDLHQDLLVGAPYYAGDGTNRGKAFIYFGGPNADKKPDVSIVGTVDYENFGQSLSSAGDFNGDGYEDFIIGAPGYNSNSGMAFIYFGGPGFDIYFDVWIAYSTSSSFGMTVTKLGDINGDGFDDVAISDATNVFVYFGNSEKSADNYQIISGYGNKPAYGGDVNGDGYDDVLIGDPQSTGTVSIFLGGSAFDLTRDVFMQAPQVDAQFACSLTGGADVNGDGYMDVIIGEKDATHNCNDRGAVHLYFGGPDMIAGSSLIGIFPDVSIYGTLCNGHFGSTVGFSKDMDGDGLSEILASESYSQAGNNTNHVCMYKGGINVKASPYRILHSTDDKGNNYFGNAFTSADFNGDGYEDIFVAASGMDKVFMYQNKPGGTESTPDLILSEVYTSSFPFGLDAAGDFNGDGYDDIIASYSSDSDPLKIYFGGEEMNALADVSSADFAHYKIKYVGDVNADGFDDFIGLNSVDEAYLYYGNVDASRQALQLSGVDYTNVKLINDGDINGDGFSDFILSTVSSEKDSFYVYFGGRSINGVPDQRIGYSYSNGPYKDYVACTDINGDGYDDMVLAFYHTYYSKNWAEIYLGSSSGLHASARIAPEEFGEFNQITEPAQLGDINHDGYGDFMLKLYAGSITYQAIVYGNGKADHFEFDILPYSNISSITNGKAGDISGDGRDDLLLSDWQNPVSSIHAFYGPAHDLNLPDMYYQDYNAENQFGLLCATGDLNGDGVMDLIAQGGPPKIDIFLSSPTNTAPRISVVKDVPADQGGKVSVVWFKSAFDGGKVASYRIERSIAPAGNGFAWESIADVKAIGTIYYSYTAATLNDALDDYLGNTYFRVTALSAQGQIVGQSNIAYGHSVDNLAPAAVANLSGSSTEGQVHLSWKANSESDLKEYHIYRSVEKDVNPDTLDLYAAVTDTVFEDNAVPNQDMYYFVRAVDVHGNSGPAGQWMYSVTGMAGDASLPDKFALEQNYPNPFNPTTSIRYQIAKQGNVQLTIYNALGEEIAVLVNQQQAPGQYTVTFNASGLASGVYYYLLKTGNRVVQTKKMILMK